MGKYILLMSNRLYTFAIYNKLTMTTTTKYLNFTADGVVNTSDNKGLLEGAKNLVQPVKEVSSGVVTEAKGIISETTADIKHLITGKKSVTKKMDLVNVALTVVIVGGVFMLLTTKSA